MSERVWAYMVTQLGVEATSGTAVAANKRLAATAIVPQPNIEAGSFQPPGYKYKTIVVNNREWTVLDISGQLVYTDIVYLFAGLFGNATISTPTGGTNSRDWVWNPASSSADAFRTYTIEWGDSTVDRVAYVCINNLALNFSRNGNSVSGQAYGQLINEDAAATSGATQIALQPALSKEIDIFLDDTSANLGTTKLTRCLSASWAINGKVGMIWPLNSANPSFAAAIEQANFESRVDLALAYDATGRSMMDRLRDNATRFLRIKATGPAIEGTIPYLIQIDCAVKARVAGNRSNQDGLAVIPVTFDVVHDAGWNKALSIKVTNTLTGL